MRTEIRNLLSVLVLPPRNFFDAVQVASKLAGLRLSFAISAPCQEEVVQFAAALSGAGALNGCKDWLHGLSLPLVFVLGGQNEPWGEQLADALALCDKEDPQPERQPSELAATEKRPELEALSIALKGGQLDFDKGFAIGQCLGLLCDAFQNSAPTEAELVEVATTIKRDLGDGLGGVGGVLIFVLDTYQTAWSRRLLVLLGLGSCGGVDITGDHDVQIDDPEKTDVSASPFSGFPIS